LCVLPFLGSVVLADDPPAFKPFVGVDLIDASGVAGTYVEGETLDVNEAGQAVGWVKDTNGRTVGFFFDPVVGEFQTLHSTPTYNTTVATGLSEPDSGTGQIVIVGYAIETPSVTDPIPCLWDSVDHYHNPAVVEYFLGSSIHGKTHAVARGGFPPAHFAVGEVYLASAGGLTSFIYEIDDDNTAFPTPLTTGSAFHIDDDLHMFGWYWDVEDERSHAYTRQWIASNNEWHGAAHDIHNNDNHYSMAYGTAVGGDALGWYWFSESNQGATLWEMTGVAEWTPHLLVPPGHINLPTSAYDGNWAGGTGPDTFEVVISIDDSAGVPGAWLWKDDLVVGTDNLFDLNDLVLLADYDPEEEAIMQRAYALNDDLWIAGSYRPDGSASAPRPLLIIPYDTDNNGVPNFREIIESKVIGPDLDADGREWLLDKSEQIRFGLHGPGKATEPEGDIEGVYIVRHKTHIKPRGEAIAEDLIELDNWIDEIVDPENGCDACKNLFEWVTGWGSVDEDEQEHNCEIILRVHSMMEAGNGDWGYFEALPANETERREALEDLQSFGYQFAPCIDFFQWGCESFGGGNGYKFRAEGDLDCNVGFDEGTIFNNLPEDCQVDAVTKMLDWQVEQMWAALIGSALRGRPLRMCSSGLTLKLVNNGYLADDERHAVPQTIEYCNRNQMYVGLHVHYPQVDEAIDGIEMLTRTGGFTDSPWDTPNAMVATEVGTMADFDYDWWTDEESYNYEEYKKYFFDEGIPDRYYEDFVDDFIGDEGQYVDTDGPQLDVVFDKFATTGFTAICYSALQFDPGDDPDNPKPYPIEALRGNSVRFDGMFYPNNGDRITPLKYRYDDAAGPYSIDGFDPHPYCDCIKDEACPGCN